MGTKERHRHRRRPRLRPIGPRPTTSPALLARGGCRASPTATSSAPRPRSGSPTATSVVVRHAVPVTLVLGGERVPLKVVGTHASPTRSWPPASIRRRGTEGRPARRRAARARHGRSRPPTSSCASSRRRSRSRPKSRIVVDPSMPINTQRVVEPRARRASCCASRDRRDRRRRGRQGPQGRAGRRRPPVDTVVAVGTKRDFRVAGARRARPARCRDAAARPPRARAMTRRRDRVRPEDSAMEGGFHAADGRSPRLRHHRGRPASHPARHAPLRARLRLRRSRRTPAGPSRATSIDLCFDTRARGRRVGRAHASPSSSCPRRCRTPRSRRPRRPSPSSQRHGLRTKKSLGQHFLVDDNVVGRILALAASRAGATSCSRSGPGIGTLTVALCAAAGAVVAVERDRDLLPGARRDDRGLPAARASCAPTRSTVAAEDARGAASAAPVALVANLPYQVAATVVLRFFEELPVAALRATVMVQAEVADRMAAEPGARTTAPTRSSCGCSPGPPAASRCRAACFLPPPRVDSAVLRLERRSRAASRPSCSRLRGRGRDGGVRAAAQDAAQLADRRVGRWAATTSTRRSPPRVSTGRGGPRR